MRARGPRTRSPWGRRNGRIAGHRPGDIITGTVRENRFSGRPAETERAEPHQPSRAENNHILLTTGTRRIHRWHAAVRDGFFLAQQPAFGVGDGRLPEESAMKKEIITPKTGVRTRCICRDRTFFDFCSDSRRTMS